MRHLIRPGQTMANSTIRPTAPVKRLTASDLREALTNLDAGFWTYDDAVEQLGAEHPDDLEKLLYFAERSAQFADADPAATKPDDSSNEPPHTASPLPSEPQMAGRLDAASSTLSPAATALPLLKSCLEDFAKAAASLEEVDSHQYGVEGLSESLSKTKQHVDSGKQHANDAFQLLIATTDTLPLSEFGTTVRRRQNTFQNDIQTWERRVHAAQTDSSEVWKLSSAFRHLREGIQAFRKECGGDET